MYEKYHYIFTTRKKKVMCNFILAFRKQHKYGVTAQFWTTHCIVKQPNF